MVPSSEFSADCRPVLPTGRTCRRNCHHSLCWSLCDGQMSGSSVRHLLSSCLQSNTCHPHAATSRAKDSNGTAIQHQLQFSRKLAVSEPAIYKGRSCPPPSKNPKLVVGHPSLQLLGLGRSCCAEALLGLHTVRSYKLYRTVTQQSENITWIDMFQL